MKVNETIDVFVCMVRCHRTAHTASCETMNDVAKLISLTFDTKVNRATVSKGEMVSVSTGLC